MSDIASENREIKRWVSSLTLQELLEAMSFIFHVDTHRSKNRSKMNPESICSHEFQLLKQMLELQVPPPVPIYSRAVTFKAASSDGLTDGRDHQIRSNRTRFQRPRLFQLLPRHSSTNDGIDPFKRNELSSLPPVIVTTIAKEGAAYGRKKTIVGRSRHGKDYADLHFDVIARSFVSPWGDIWSVACTDAQRRADEFILRGTHVQFGDVSFGTNMIISNKSIQKSKATADFGDLSVHCFFRCFTNAPSNTREILDMLRVASRGNFLSETTVSGSRVPFFAPWFDPTKEWFSLPMYLASRFEVSLRDSFQQFITHKSMHSSVRVNCFSGFEIVPMNRDFHSVYFACKEAVMNFLKEDQKLIATCKIRDLMIWKILIHAFGTDSTLPRQDFISLTCVPIILLGTSIDQVRAKIMMHYQSVLSLASEKSLLSSIENGENLVQSLPVLGSTRKQKKRKKWKNATKIKSSFIPDPSNSSTSSSLQAPPEPPSYERNRNIIFVLSLLDDVINSVFIAVGVGASSISDENKGLVHTLVRSHALQSSDNSTVFFKWKKRTTCSVSADALLPFCEGTQLDSTTKPRQESRIVPTSQLVIKRCCDDNGSTPEASLLPVEHSSTRQMLSLQEFMMQNQFQHHHDCTYFPRGDADSFQVAQDLSLDSDAWWNNRRYQTRDRSLFVDFFLTKNDAGKIFASSTAASLASSSLDRNSSDSNCDIVDDESCARKYSVSSIDDNLSLGPVGMTVIEECDDERALDVKSRSGISPTSDPQARCSSLNKLNQVTCNVDETTNCFEPIKSSDNSLSDSHRTTSLVEPPTPPPQLSPILVSLADLNEFRMQASDSVTELKVDTCIEVRLSPLNLLSSVQSSPKLSQPTFIRDDCRTPLLRDDHQSCPKRKSSTMIGNRNYRRAVSVSSHDALDMNQSTKSFDQNKGPDNLRHRSALSITSHHPPTKEVIIDAGNFNLSFCAQSDSAKDGPEDSSHLNVIPRTSLVPKEGEYLSTMDETTTISSVPNATAGELNSMREERNGFRDMCLTLASENSKLKNLLALMAGKIEPSVPNDSVSNNSLARNYLKPSYDPEYIRPFFHSTPSKPDCRLGAMSDAGLHHDMNVSEDGTDVVQESVTTNAPPSVSNTLIRAAGFSGTETAPVEQSGHIGVGMLTCQHIKQRDTIGPFHVCGLQSRLTNEINVFLKRTSTQLKKLTSRRVLAMTRLRRLVTLLWPRAQIKVYGSHINNLCLPSSDVDFVICLPAVHKNAPVDKAGVLEGRNAINEPHQKVLARKLRYESWIEPRSIKIIERTIVPVIKVQTRDAHAKQIQLDITFESPEHHGLKAAQMVKSMINDLPMIRPLVLVLKQFLLERGLLTAYTGGLSSYCLFLMVARYLQEQPESWMDPGSLLIGFLDFFGNHFDPRSTGISVSKRRYFSRVHYAQHSGGELIIAAQIPSSLGHPNTPYYGRPFTFDPLFVEDPIHPSNNVGRNAFRIFQVKRVFSDAHRALVASLEWDINSSSELDDCAEYPLLKCLLQNEDGNIEIDDRGI